MGGQEKVTCRTCREGTMRAAMVAEAAVEVLPPHYCSAPFFPTHTHTHTQPDTIVSRRQL